MLGSPEDQPIVDEQLDVAIIVVGSNDIMDYAEQWAGRAAQVRAQGSPWLGQRTQGGVMIICSSSESAASIPGNLHEATRTYSDPTHKT